MKIEYNIEGTYHDLRAYPERLQSIIAVLLTNEKKLSDGYGYYNSSTTQMLEHIAGVIFAAITVVEREACAVIAEDYFSPATWRYAQDQPYTIGREIAAAIRTRGDDG